MPQRGYSKDTVVVIDVATKREITRYPSVAEASRDLGIPICTIYSAISVRTAAYECYFVYSRCLDGFLPRKHAFRRVRGLKVSERLEQLRRNLENV